MTEPNAQVDAYFDALPQPQKDICLAIRRLIFDQFPQMTEAYKWHFAVYYMNGKRICSVAGWKQHANMELYYGTDLTDPQRRISGNGKRTRHLKFHAMSDVDVPYLTDLIAQSVALAQSE